MKNSKLIKEYKGLYEKIRELVKDDEVFPPINDEDYKMVVSSGSHPTNWMGIPSFGMSKEDMKWDGVSHISFGLHSEGKLRANLIYNGKPGVKNFLEVIRSPFERDEFISYLKSLDNSYVLQLRYCEEPHFLSPNTDVIVFKEWNCENLVSSKVDEICKNIEYLLYLREIRQKERGKSKKTTVSIKIWKNNFYQNDDILLKNVFTKFGSMLRMLHKNKSVIIKEKLIKNEKKISSGINPEEQQTRLKHLREQGIKF